MMSSSPSPMDPGSDRPFSTGPIIWLGLIGCLVTLFFLWDGPSRLKALPEFYEFNWSLQPTSTGELIVPNFQTIRLNGVSYEIEVRDTDAGRRAGLSHREPLAPQTGMRFIFDQPDRHVFWMKDMRFPLDMIFLRNGVIVSIAKNVPFPKTTTETPATVQPQQLFENVLELPAGDADKLNLKVGQKIELPE